MTASLLSPVRSPPGSLVAPRLLVRRLRASAGPEQSILLRLREGPDPSFGFRTCAFGGFALGSGTLPM